MALTDYTTAQSADLGSQIKWAGEAAAVKQQALSMLEEAASLIAEVELSAAKTADALCGSQPSNQAASAIQKQPEGFFDRIEEIAAKLRHSAASISDDMRRIQNRL